MKKSRDFIKKAALIALALVTLQLLACKKAVIPSGVAAFAQPKAVVSSANLKVIEALQESFREISSTLLPAVVEVDVTETRTVNAIDPFEDFRRFFFGPDSGDDFAPRKKKYESKGLGSGVIVRRVGNTLYVLTNNHVAGEATKIIVKLNDTREFEAKLVGADARMDIALVSFESSDDSIPVAALGDSDKVQTGDICFAMGAPLGFSQSVTQGIVSAKGRSGQGIKNINDFIQTDAAINQGNSGGPLVNIYGEVIGINTWIASQSGGSQGLGFSIPINNIKSAIDSFIETGKVVYGWLGVSLYAADDDYKKELGLDKKPGALVTQIFIGSPAQKAGIVIGDYITKVDGHDARDVEEVQRLVGRIPAGKSVPFVVIRNGKEANLTVKIEERTDKNSGENAKLWPGFAALPLTDEVRKEYEIESDVKGVLVAQVTKKSPAAALRLQDGDIITAVNGVKVKNLQEFYAELGKVTKSVNFDVYNSGGTITTGTYKFQ